MINALDRRYGSTYRARSLSRLLAELGHQVIYAESNAPDQAGTLNIPQSDSLIGFGLSTLRRGMVALAQSCDALYLQKFLPHNAFAFMAGRLKGKPLLVDWDDLDTDLQGTRARRALVGASERLLPRLATGITTHSQNLADHARHVTGLPVTIVPQGVDTALFDPGRFDRQALRRRLNPRGGPIIGYLGTLTHGGARDLDLLLAASAPVLKKNGKARLLLIGGGPLKPVIENRLARLGITGQTTITGIISSQEVARHLASLDLGLLYMRPNPGNRMRVSLKLLEYLSMGLPVVGQAVGESAELFQRFGLKAGQSVDGLSSAIYHALESPAPPNLDVRGYIVAHHDWVVTREALNKVFPGDG